MHCPQFQHHWTKTFIAAAVGSWLLLIFACARVNGPVTRPKDSELCSALRDVVSQADSRFQKLKTTPTIDPLSGTTKWETRPVFPDSQCDVIDWGGGRTNYVCTWQEGEEAQARETYLQNSALMARCLAPEWARSETRGQTGGATVFTRTGSVIQVVMRYFRPRRAFGSTWETSLTIGDEVVAEPR